MIFSLVVYSSPHTQAGSRSALHFATSLLHQGHQLYRVFFYGDGVLNACQTLEVKGSKAPMSAQWSALAKQYQLDLVVCVTAALKRNIITEEDARQPDKAKQKLAEGFQVSGLGQLIDAAMHSDRTITFR